MHASARGRRPQSGSCRWVRLQRFRENAPGVARPGRELATLAKYHNRSIETAKVIEELIAMAKDFQDALKRNEDLGLNPDEIAVYDALAEKPEVLKEMGDETLKKLAVELTEKLGNSTTVDWQVRDSVRASMRLMIKRLLRKHKYPPAGQEEAVTMVLKQAEALADAWSK